MKKSSTWCSFSLALTSLSLLTLGTQLPDSQEAQVTWRKYLKEFQLTDSLLVLTDQQPLYTTARPVSEEALKANSIRCSSNCSYVRDPRQEPSSWAQWISSIMRNNNKWLFLFCTMKFEMVYFGAIDNWNRDQVAKWLAYGYTAVGLQILKVSYHLVNVDLHFFYL